MLRLSTVLLYRHFGQLKNFPETESLPLLLQPKPNWLINITKIPFLLSAAVTAILSEYPQPELTRKAGKLRLPQLIITEKVHMLLELSDSIAFTYFGRFQVNDEENQRFDVKVGYLIDPSLIPLDHSFFLPLIDNTVLPQLPNYPYLPIRFLSFLIHYFSPFSGPAGKHPPFAGKPLSFSASPFQRHQRKLISAFSFSRWHSLAICFCSIYVALDLSVTRF
ncbi:hypothetical protein VNO80_08978 [Phaseolus coccineus]|uniref:Uncharacterized protein n=1 Tax=Phaseolus coccineus TaxID=3886 RepID=A0AAN9N5C4_PHACN